MALSVPCGIRMDQEFADILAPGGNCVDTNTVARARRLRAQCTRNKNLGKEPVVFRQSDFENVRQIMDGENGSTYQADLVLDDDRMVTVVLKTPKNDDNQFVCELAANQHLQLEKHPNVLNYLGWCPEFRASDEDPSQAALVLPFKEGGSLEEYVHNGSNGPLPFRQVVEFALQIARAVLHVHEIGLLHNDIALRNVLLASSPEDSDNPKVVLCDLGSSSFQESARPEVHFNWREAAIEVVLRSEFSPASDVWAMGKLLVELSIHQEPLADISREDLKRQFNEGKNPLLEQMEMSHYVYDGHRNWHHLVEKCLALVPSQRPSMSNVVQYLELLSKRIEASCSPLDGNLTIKRRAGTRTKSDDLAFFVNLFEDMDLLNARAHAKRFVEAEVHRDDLHDLSANDLEELMPIGPRNRLKKCLRSVSIPFDRSMHNPRNDNLRAPMEVDEIDSPMSASALMSASVMSNPSIIPDGESTQSAPRNDNLRAPMEVDEIGSPMSASALMSASVMSNPSIIPDGESTQTAVAPVYRTVDIGYGRSRDPLYRYPSSPDTRCAETLSSDELSRMKRMKYDRSHLRRRRSVSLSSIVRSGARTADVPPVPGGSDHEARASSTNSSRGQASVTRKALTPESAGALSPAEGSASSRESSPVTRPSGDIRDNVRSPGDTANRGGSRSVPNPESSSFTDTADPQSPETRVDALKGERPIIVLNAPENSLGVEDDQEMPGVSVSSDRAGDLQEPPSSSVDEACDAQQRLRRVSASGLVARGAINVDTQRKSPTRRSASARRPRRGTERPRGLPFLHSAQRSHLHTAKHSASSATDIPPHHPSVQREHSSDDLSLITEQREYDRSTAHKLPRTRHHAWSHLQPHAESLPSSVRTGAHTADVPPVPGTSDYEAGASSTTPSRAHASVSHEALAAGSVGVLATAEGSPSSRGSPPVTSSDGNIHDAQSLADVSDRGDSRHVLNPESSSVSNTSSQNPKTRVDTLKGARSVAVLNSPEHPFDVDDDQEIRAVSDSSARAGDLEELPSRSVDEACGPQHRPRTVNSQTHCPLGSDSDPMHMTRERESLLDASCLYEAGGSYPSSDDTNPSNRTSEPNRSCPHSDDSVPELNMGSEPRQAQVAHILENYAELVPDLLTGASFPAVSDSTTGASCDIEPDFLTGAPYPTGISSLDFSNDPFAHLGRASNDPFAHLGRTLNDPFANLGRHRNDVSQFQEEHAL